MKRNSIFTGMIIAASVFFSCSGNGNGSTGNCSNAVVADWKESSTTYESQAAVAGMFTSSSFTVTIVACPEGGVIEPGAPVTSMVFRVEEPFAPGTYSLQDEINMGTIVTGASYHKDEVDYYTDAGHTGTLVITEVDEAGERFTGTFQFTAVSEDGTQTVTITQGEITNGKMSN